MPRPSNTKILGPVNATELLRHLEDGQPFISPQPSNKDNPCVYYKSHTSCGNHHAVQQGGGTTTFPNDYECVPVTVVETHIRIGAQR